MHEPLELKVWIVEPHDELRDTLHELATGVPADADVMTEDEFRRSIDRGRRPDALMIDGSTLLRLDGHRAALDGMLRTLVVTGRDPSELPMSMLERSSVQFLRKPFTTASIERGLEWLTGSGDDSWADPVTTDESEAATPLG
jgi:DNA-binding response OmpR family regulator